MSVRSGVSKARKDSISLRTTIPESICQFLEISNKNELEWKMYTRENIRMVMIRKNILL